MLGKITKENLWRQKCSNFFTDQMPIVTSVDIGVNANLELVYMFCYLGDMLSVDRDADGINSGSWYHCLPIRIYH